MIMFHFLFFTWGFARYCFILDKTEGPETDPRIAHKIIE